MESLIGFLVVVLRLEKEFGRDDGAGDVCNNVGILLFFIATSLRKICLVSGNVMESPEMPQQG